MKSRPGTEPLDGCAESVESRGRRQRNGGGFFRHRCPRARSDARTATPSTSSSSIPGRRWHCGSRGTRSFRGSTHPGERVSATGGRLAWLCTSRGVSRCACSHIMSCRVRPTGRLGWRPRCTIRSSSACTAARCHATPTYGRCAKSRALFPASGIPGKDGVGFVHWGHSIKGSRNCSAARPPSDSATRRSGLANTAQSQQSPYVSLRSR